MRSKIFNILLKYCVILHVYIKNAIISKIITKLLNWLVNGNINISNKNLTQIPVHFEKINGYFNCNINQLTTLEGGPKEVGRSYSCTINRLTTLIGAPNVCDNFNCNNNLLTSLEGCPRLIKGNLHCENNPLLKYLWGIGRVQGNVDYDVHNEINEWIIACMRRDIIFPHFTLEENIKWIMKEHQYSSLLRAPQEVRNRFSSNILLLVDLKIL